MTTLMKGDRVRISEGGLFAGDTGTVEREGFVHPDIPTGCVVVVKLDRDLGYSVGNVLVNADRVVKE